jgi:hypothetical protein
MEWEVTIVSVLPHCRIRHVCRQRDYAHSSTRFADTQRGVRESFAPGSASPEILA